MAKIRSIDKISEKWARVTPQRAADYEDGVKNPKEDWETATKKAKDAYAQGVQEAITEDRFAKGVSKAGTIKWQRKAVEVGVRRWPEGVRIAQPDYETGFAPYRDVIEKTELPPRFPKGDPRNIDRVLAIAKALHEKKIRG